MLGGALRVHPPTLVLKLVYAELPHQASQGSLVVLLHSVHDRSQGHMLASTGRKADKQAIMQGATGPRIGTWATTTALWYSLTSGVGGVRGSTPLSWRLTLVGESLLEVVASSSCRAANLLQAAYALSAIPVLRMGSLAM